MRIQTKPKRALSEALASCRGALLSVALFSGVVNVLMLAGSLYMLQVYDRVIPSRSVPTLIGITVLIILVYAIQGFLDVIRQRIMTRIGAEVDFKLGDRMNQLMIELPLRAGRRSDGLQPIRDLDTVRGFLSSLGPTALFDLPWAPIYLALCFAFHPLLGWMVTGGVVLLSAIALITEYATRKPSKDVVIHAASRHVLAEAARRNAEVLAAMGMSAPMRRRLRVVGDDYLASHARLSDRSNALSAASKMLRMFLQSAVLGLGAWLVINDQITAGVMIAASILMGRALAPIELSIAHWKTFVAARESWKRLGTMMDSFPDPAEPMGLPNPHQVLSLDTVAVTPPGAREVYVQGIEFKLQAGQGLGIIGPSASGKSTLVRAIAGIWPLSRGHVRLDGADLAQWSARARGAFIGYMPQDVELFDGTVAQNIARFSDESRMETIVAAAKAAGAHDMIIRLSDGYDTRVGEDGSILSAGQRQRVALARALYGDPFMLVLDEPNSNLDSDGDTALTKAIQGVRDRGGIVIVVAHRPSALAAIDQVLVMVEGRVQAFGTKAEVQRKILASRGEGTSAPNVAAIQGAA